jgi:serine/threonine protein kinase
VSRDPSGNIHGSPPEGAAARLAAGAHLGPYRIEALFGSGGMGDVYQARDERLDRTVAIKILPSADPVFEAAVRARGARGLGPQSPSHLHHS